VAAVGHQQPKETRGSTEASGLLASRRPFAEKRKRRERNEGAGC